jgi:hypothetical protein
VSDPTFHDPHCVRLCPSNPDRLYQQNHCGIYRLDRPGAEWVRIGKRMPKRVGDVGFPAGRAPARCRHRWVFPMDGQTVWPRTSPDGRPAVYVTRNGGKGWQRLDGPARASGLVDGQAPGDGADALDPVGLYFGTTSGELWMSRDEGRDWSCIARHLPEIYAVEGGRAGVMKVLIPTPLNPTPKGPRGGGGGATLAEVLADLDRQFPGIRFRMIDEQDRMRPHIRFFVNGQIVASWPSPWASAMRS